MAQILFPKSHAPGKDAVEGSGSLVNAYAEPLQEGAPSGHVIRRPPGLTQFADIDESTFRGCWFDGVDTLYAAYAGTLLRVNSAGTETTVGVLPGARFTYLDNDTSVAAGPAVTFSAMALGSPHPNRKIVVAVLYNNTGDFPSGLTVNGVAASDVVSQSDLISLHIAEVPNGTTGDVVVTFATPVVRSAVAIWRLDGAATTTASDSGGDEDTSKPGVSLDTPTGGARVAASVSTATGAVSWANVTEDFDIGVDSTFQFSGGSAGQGVAATLNVDVTASVQTYLVAASWAGDDTGFVTFAKDNAVTPNQVLCSETLGAYSFTQSALTELDVNNEVPNSVCYGEGYFFYTTPGGLCYASNLNSTTVTGTDYTRAEARAEPLVRGVYYNGQLFLFGETHTEVYASNGNPNATGFPFNYTTSIWRGLIGVGAIAGFEEGFEGQVIWVADDNSVRALAGYAAVVISNPDVERDIEDCATKSAIRCWLYDVDGHACVGVHIPSVRTWVYDLSTGFWHIRQSLDAVDCRLHGNTVKAFDKWIGGDTDSGDLLYVDDTAYSETGDAMTFEVESIAMEAFPQRLQVSRADFNFVGGVGTTATPDPMVKISWSDDGGHTWSDPVSKKLGEAGRYLEQIRVNRVGLTKHKGRCWRLQVEDEAYVGLLGGSMDVAGRP